MCHCSFVRVKQPLHQGLWLYLRRDVGRLCAFKFVRQDGGCRLYKEIGCHWVSVDCNTAVVEALLRTYHAQEWHKCRLVG